MHYVKLCRRFNWRLAASKYIFRTQTMEDYLAVYIHALATYRYKSSSRALIMLALRLVVSIPSRSTFQDFESEGIEELSQKLIGLSESCPDDIVQVKLSYYDYEGMTILYYVIHFRRSCLQASLAWSTTRQRV